MALKILAMVKHEVDLGADCRIFVEAKPFHVMIPSLVEVQQSRSVLSLPSAQSIYVLFKDLIPFCLSYPQIDTEVCPRRILISNLPKMDIDFLLVMLEIHFSKRHNGGGEVEECHVLQDSGTVVLTFVESGGEHVLASSLHTSTMMESKIHKKLNRSIWS